LRRTDEVVRIASSRSRIAQMPVYNLSVAEPHTDAVGDGQVLAHDSCPVDNAGNGAGVQQGSPADPARGGAAPEGTLVRRGSSPESAQRLAKQAAAAESAGAAQNGVPYGHGVSVTTPESNARLARDPADASSATRKALEAAGFEVRHTPTRSDPNHHTVQLPKPVTPAVADLFNAILGRK
jgi:hypothetical protein